jgi:uncharacterized protein
VLYSLVFSVVSLAGSPDADFEAFVTYDKRLLAAAASIGLPTASPGA